MIPCSCAIDRPVCNQGEDEHAVRVRIIARQDRDKMRAHRERLRRQGLRPTQIWVPDARSPGFAAEAARQSRAVASSANANHDQDFIDGVAVPGNE